MQFGCLVEVEGAFDERIADLFDKVLHRDPEIGLCRAKAGGRLRDVWHIEVLAELLGGVVVDVCVNEGVVLNVDLAAVVDDVCLLQLGVDVRVEFGLVFGIKVFLDDQPVAKLDIFVIG